MVMGGGGLIIKEALEIDRKVQEKYRLIPPEEVKASEKTIVNFQQDALLTAKGSIKDRQDVVEGSSS